MNKIESFLMRFNKSKYIKIWKFKSDKSVKVTYYHENKLDTNILINSDHIFYHNGYRTIITSDTVKETLNPLNITSLYPVDKFQSAIETKVIKDVFNNLIPSKIDIMKLLMIANICIGLGILYFIVTGGK